MRLLRIGSGISAIVAMSACNAIVGVEELPGTGPTGSASSSGDGGGMGGNGFQVLVEGVSRESDLLLGGRWYGQAPGIDGVTYLSDGQVAPGSLVKARVTQASDYDLAATLEL